MNDKTKDEVKKNVATGASTAAGATAGVIIGAAIAPGSVEAAEAVTPAPIPGAAPTPSPDPVTPPAPNPHPGDKPEIEVLGYDRVVNEDGSLSDIAVVNVNGNEVGVIDIDLDGKADALVCDINQNGIIEDDEVEFVQGQGVDMQPFADAAGFNELFAQNDLPDYVNDADVDTYMA